MISTIRRLARPRIRRWQLAGGLLIVVVIAVLACRTRPAAAPPASRWVPVQPQALENRLGLVGRIDAATQTTIAAPFEGVVQNVEATEGQRVERGQPLLTFDTTLLDLQLRDALAAQLIAQRAVRDIQDWPNSEEVARAHRALTQAQMELSDTETRLADTRRLFERGIVARMEVDALVQQARAQQLDLTAAQSGLRAALGKGQGESRQIADMQLANARSRYQVLQALRAQRELVAPFAGIVLRPRKADGNGSLPAVQQGMRVVQGAPLFELASLDRLRAVARVEETDLHQLSEDMPVQISGDGFEGLSLQGRVVSIGAQGLSPDTYGGATYEVVVTIDPLSSEQQQRVRLGMNARLAIITYRVANGLAVPAEAVHQDDAGSTFIVYRRSMEAAAERVPVTLGRAVPQGVEIFGMVSGYVELPGREAAP
ncbi:efflux RND transporter periplasmic adaptor subunit [Ralstonia pseudosolanacearum]